MQTVKEYRLNDAGVYVPFVDVGDGVLQQVAFAPQPGSQEIFLKVSETECLYEGTRGNGKSVAMLLDFVANVNQGYGDAWRGIILRRTHPQLAEIVALSKTFIKQICPGASFNSMKSYWDFPDGARLSFAHFNEPAQYSDYLGHSYPWIGWEELTTWPSPDCYTTMFACSRSTNPRMPRKIRATTNPYGVGRNWVMQRFRLPLDPGKLLGPAIVDSRDEKGNIEPPRRVVHGYLGENVLLKQADPDYAQRISASATNESQRRAWLDGSWLITAGGMFDDLWYELQSNIIVPRFEIPRGWRLFRGYDHGSSKPFAVLWAVRSNGEDVVFPDGSARATIPDDLFLVGELYGWTGKADVGLRLPIAEIARRIKAYEAARGWTGHVHTGVADSAIFDSDDGRPSIATDFERAGIVWERADKGPGSRTQGWEQLRKRFIATQRINGIRETPGLFVVGDECPQFKRTVPSLPRSDKNLDDVEDSSEDHIGDCLRYVVRWDSGPRMSTRRRQLV
jgi:hypothetical protein